MSATIYVNNQGRYGVKFYSPHLVTQVHKGVFELKEDAEHKASTLETEYYADHSVYLPKGVTVNKQSKMFVLACKRFIISQGEQFIMIGSAKRLKDIKKIRENIILQLV